MLSQTDRVRKKTEKERKKEKAREKEEIKAEQTHTKLITIPDPNLEALSGAVNNNLHSVLGLNR